MKNKLFHIITGMFIASFFCGCENSDAEDSQLEQIPAVLSGKAYTFNPDAEGERLQEYPLYVHHRGAGGNRGHERGPSGCGYICGRSG